MVPQLTHATPSWDQVTRYSQIPQGHLVSGPGFISMSPDNNNRNVHRVLFLDAFDKYSNGLK